MHFSVKTVRIIREILQYIKPSNWCNKSSHSHC